MSSYCTVIIKSWHANVRRLSQSDAAQTEVEGIHLCWYCSFLYQPVRRVIQVFQSDSLYGDFTTSFTLLTKACPNYYEEAKREGSAGNWFGIFSNACLEVLKRNMKYLPGYLPKAVITCL
jgi:hypothetical protein